MNIAWQKVSKIHYFWFLGAFFGLICQVIGWNWNRILLYLLYFSLLDNHYCPFLNSRETFGSEVTFRSEKWRKRMLIACMRASSFLKKNIEFSHILHGKILKNLGSQKATERQKCKNNQKRQKCQNYQEIQKSHRRQNCQKCQIRKVPKLPNRPRMANCQKPIMQKADKVKKPRMTKLPKFRKSQGCHKCLVCQDCRDWQLCKDIPGCLEWRYCRGWRSKFLKPFKKWVFLERNAFFEKKIFIQNR